MITTSNMGLKVWNLLTDLFDHNQLANNWTAVDQHDHSGTKGVQIGTPGIQDGAITTAKIASQAITRPLLVPGVGYLQTRSAPGNVTANPGDIIQCGVPATITLPPPTVNSIVGAFTWVATSAAPITIQPSAGPLIFGEGLGAGVSSIVLGAAGTIVLIADGANWWIVSGRQDTGWVPLTLAAHWTATTGSYAPAIRLVGDMVHMCGNLTGDNTNAAPLTAPLATTFRPAATVFFSDDAATPANITSGGVLTSHSTVLCALDRVHYRLF